MITLSTLWVPDTNLVGESSVPAMVIAVAVWVLVEMPCLADVRKAIILGTFVLFSIFWVMCPACLFILKPLNLASKYRSFPNYNDFVANYILLGVAMIFGLKLRKLHPPSRACGNAVVTVVSAAVLVELFGVLRWLKLF